VTDRFLSTTRGSYAIPHRRGITGTTGGIGNVNVSLDHIPAGERGAHLHGVSGHGRVWGHPQAKQARAQEGPRATASSSKRAAP
jgi:hypothetical protein